MSDLDFGAPVPVDELPAASTRGGRQSNAPAYDAWLKQLNKPGTYELASDAPDGAHSTSRVQALRKLVKEGSYNGVEILTRPVEIGKRYRIFAKVTTAAK